VVSLKHTLLWRPIQDPEHPPVVVPRVYGRALVFFQFPRSNSWWYSHHVVHVISVEKPRHSSQVLVRLLTKNDIPYLLLQLVSQDSVQDLFYRIKTLTYRSSHDLSFMFVVCEVVYYESMSTVRIRFVSQGVFSTCSVVLGISCTFSVIFFNDSRGSTLFISLYMSFA
jgi:hypothetical protein